MLLSAHEEHAEVLPRCSEQTVPTATTLLMIPADMMVMVVPAEPEVHVGALPTMRAVEQSSADSAMMHIEMFFVLEPDAYYVGLLSAMRVVEQS